MGALEDYGFTWETVIFSAGAEVQDPEGVDVFDGMTLGAFLIFGPHKSGHLWLFERVIVEGDTAKRSKFSYHFEYDGDLIFRYNLEPLVHPENPMHKHTPDGRRLPWHKVTLEEVFEEAWDVVNERDAAEE